MKPENKIDRIITKLLQQTKSGEAVWTADDSVSWQAKPEGSYTFNSDSSSVEISGAHGLDQFPFLLKIYNASGTVIWREEVNGLATNADEVQELYRLAMRQALKVDETLDGLLQDLDKLDNTPF